MKFKVKKINGSLLFEAEIECHEDASYGIKLGLAIHWGYKNGKSLKNGDFRKAVLRNLQFDRLTFENSRFDGSTFENSTFYNSTFDGSTFYNSRFYNSRFYNSRFDGSTFYNSRFYNSRFDGSTFENSRFYNSTFENSRFYNSTFDGSTFENSRFYNSTFDGSTFDEKTLRNFKHDMWSILIRYKNEVPELINYIKQGKIDGTCYSGECSCLMGTFAAIKNKNINDNEFSIKDENSPVEIWFSMIKPGDTPENNFASKMALEWIEEFLILVKNKNA